MKRLALILALTLTFRTIGFAFVASDASTTLDSPRAEKVRTEIQKYDSTKKMEIKVTLRSENELKGYVSKSDDELFDLTEKSGHVSRVRYEEVNKVNSFGLSLGAKIAIVVVSAVAVIAVVVVVGLKRAGF